MMGIAGWSANNSSGRRPRRLACSCAVVPLSRVANHAELRAVAPPLSGQPRGISQVALPWRPAPRAVTPPECGQLRAPLEHGPERRAYLARPSSPVPRLVLAVCFDAVAIPFSRDADGCARTCPDTSAATFLQKGPGSLGQPRGDHGGDAVSCRPGARVPRSCGTGSSQTCVAFDFCAGGVAQGELSSKRAGHGDDGIDRSLF